MIAEILATVEKGELKLDGSLPFPDQTRVKLHVEPIWDPVAARQAWQALLRGSTSIRLSGAAAPIRARSCMIAIDTNVFVYAFDASEPVKQGQACAFIDRVFSSGEATVIPWQVAVELLARLRNGNRPAK